MNRRGSLLGDLFARVADAGRALMPGTPPPLGQQCDDLLAGKGEAIGLAQAQAILRRYAALGPDEKRAFFQELRDRFGVDRAAVEQVLERLKADGDAALRQLHAVSEPRSQELIRRLNRAPGGTRGLVAMRKDLLAAAVGDASLRPLDEDFRHLFASWFNRGFLELRRIDWSTPAATLEKIIQYEAVHEISGWDDLRRRVAAADRRLYAFFHPALADDPLIFVEVALTDTIPAAIAPILADGRKPLDPRTATTAVFYSISNCQAGLKGISFGNFLIKQVVEELRHDYPNLNTFVTLSPVPGLRSWALARREAGKLPARFAPVVEGLEAGRPEPGVTELTAHYLVESRSPRGGASDSVARFHLGNGARLEAINARADESPRGMKGSWGTMVNYLYDLATIEKNHEAYSNADEIVVSAAVRRLLKAR